MTRTETEDADVFDNTAAHRYEIMSGSHLAGWAVYAPTHEGVAFTHTEVQPAFSGRGLGGRLAKAALDDIRRRGVKATPLCPFIADYIRHHPAYIDLVDERHRAAMSEDQPRRGGQHG